MFQERGCCGPCVGLVNQLRQNTFSSFLEGYHVLQLRSIQLKVLLERCCSSCWDSETCLRGNIRLAKAFGGCCSSSNIIYRVGHCDGAIWIKRLIHKSISLCGGSSSIDDHDTAAIPSPPDFDASFLRNRSIMVFDDFNNVGEDDIKFVKSLFYTVEAKGVLLFVLVRDEQTANHLARFNNWGRIFPLPGIWEDLSDAGAREKVPEWKAIEWTQAQLKEVVRSRMGEIPRIMPEIQDGDNPYDVLASASEIVLREQASTIALER